MHSYQNPLKLDFPEIPKCHWKLSLEQELLWSQVDEISEFPEQELSPSSKVEKPSDASDNGSRCRRCDGCGWLCRFERRRADRCKISDDCGNGSHMNYFRNSDGNDRYQYVYRVDGGHRGAIPIYMKI